jgi:Acetyltransferase (GNAT) domain
MPYTCRLSDSIDQVDLDAWQRVCSANGAPIFMDPRFIRGVETSMEQCRFWYVIVYDDAARPVACAGLSTLTIDLMDIADVAKPPVSWVIRCVPLVLPRFRELKVLFCSLPGSPGQKSLAVMPTRESAQILSALDVTMSRLAADIGMDVIIYKEFGKNDLPWMDALLNLGYRRIPTPPTHFFEHSFSSFAQYCKALKTGYRKGINRSVRKLKDGGIEQSVLTDSEQIVRAYTPEVHALYLQMVAKAKAKLEVNPIEYFHQLALQLGGEVDLITLSKDLKMVAFAWGLQDGSTYRFIYGGVDDQLNREFDLYFNIVYAVFDRAFRKGAERIDFGQTATAFKTRIGCYSEPLYAFARGLGPLMSRFFYYAGGLVVVRKPSIPSYEIFNSTYVAGQNDRTSLNAR